MRILVDTNVVAAMRRHEISHILTFNAGDFSRFTDITVLAPVAVVAGAGPPVFGRQSDHRARVARYPAASLLIKAMTTGGKREGAKAQDVNRDGPGESDETERGRPARTNLRARGAPVTWLDFNTHPPRWFSSRPTRTGARPPRRPRRRLRRAGGARLRRAPGSAA